MKNSKVLDHFLAVCLMHYIWNMLNVIIEIIETFHTVSCSEFCMCNSDSCLQWQRMLHAWYTNVCLRTGNMDMVFCFVWFCFQEPMLGKLWRHLRLNCANNHLSLNTFMKRGFSKNGFFEKTQARFLLPQFKMTYFIPLNFIPICSYFLGKCSLLILVLNHCFLINKL